MGLCCGRREDVGLGETAETTNSRQCRTCERIWCRVQGPPDDLVVIIDPVGIALSSPEGSEIDGLAVTPKDTTRFREPGEGVNQTVLRLAADQSAIVDPVREAAHTAWERAEIGRYAVLPHERAINRTVKEAVWRVGIGNGGISRPGSRASIVYSPRVRVAKQAVRSAEGAHVDESVMVVLCSGLLRGGVLRGHARQHGQRRE